MAFEYVVCFSIFCRLECRIKINIPLQISSPWLVRIESVSYALWNSDWHVGRQVYYSQTFPEKGSQVTRVSRGSRVLDDHVPHHNNVVVYIFVHFQRLPKPWVGLRPI